MDDIEEDLRDISEDIEVVYFADNEVFDEDIEASEPTDDDHDSAFNNKEVTDLSRLSFKRHTRSVFSCDLSCDGRLAVTGGEDDMAYVWSTATGDVYMECTGHKDSVTEVGFNFDGRYVVTGDMSGMIQVWSIGEKNLIWCYEGEDLEWTLWHRSGNVLIAGTQSGDVYVWQIPQGHCKVIGSHGAPATCGKLLPDGKRIVIGYGDGHIKLWDIKSASSIWQLTNFEVDITSLETNSDGSLIAIAPLSQLVKTVDGKIVGNFSSRDVPDVETLIFDDELGILVTGALSGQICIWDIAKNTIRHTAEIGFAVTRFKWALSGVLLVSTTDGSVYVCDVRSGTLLHTLTGHKEDILSMQVSHDKTFVLTTSDDCTAKIFDIKA